MINFVYTPQNEKEILDIFLKYKIPKTYYNKNIEIISYSKNKITKQEIVNIKYWKKGKTLDGTKYSKVYIIERGYKNEYNVESPSPESEFLLYL